MRVSKGTVISGKVVVDGEPLEEDATVTILARESNETFELTPEDEAQLLDSLAQAERGEMIKAQSLVHDLDQT